jgi:hypothetical protein
VKNTLTIHWRYQVLEITVLTEHLWALARAFSNEFCQVDAMEGDVVIRPICGYRSCEPHALIRIRLHEDETSQIPSLLRSFSLHYGIDNQDAPSIRAFWIGFDVLLPLKSDLGWKFMDEFERKFSLGYCSGSSPTAIERYSQRNEGTLSVIVVVESQREQEFIAFARDFCVRHEMEFKESWRLVTLESDATA